MDGREEASESTSFVSRLFNFRSSTELKKKEEERQEAAPLNNINELQVLQGHTDIVRVLLKIDEQRLASASDDAKIIIWNHTTGEKLMVLEKGGHTVQVTCLLLLGRNKLASGSSDKTIKIWDLTTGECKRTLTAHQGSIKCLCMLPNNQFCSGANDRQLCVWSLDGELLGTIERQEEENLHCLICISDKTVVTASNSSLLLVYNIDTFSFRQLLAYHRESVQCLVKLSNQLFASGSIDGTIVVWQTEALTPFNILHYPEKYKNVNTKIYIYSVHYLLPLNGRYLAAAIAHGLSIFDVYTNDCIMEIADAHESCVNCLISLYDSTRLVSCSADASIKLWELPRIIKDPGTTVSINPTVAASPKRSRKKRRPPMPAVFLGDMWGHSEAVHALVPLSDSGFASCSGDTWVLLWKDGRVQSEIRNGYAAHALRQHQRRSEYFRMLERENGRNSKEFNSRKNMSDDSISEFSEYDDTSEHVNGNDVYKTPPLNRSEDVPELFLDELDDGLLEEPLYGAGNPGDVGKLSGSWPNIASAAGDGQLARERPASAASVLINPNPNPNNDHAVIAVNNTGALRTSANYVSPLKRASIIQVPEYIISYAERLKREKKLSLTEIEEHLKSEGHSDTIVNVIISELKQK